MLNLLSRDGYDACKEKSNEPTRLPYSWPDSIARSEALAAALMTRRGRVSCSVIDAADSPTYTFVLHKHYPGRVQVSIQSGR